MDLDDFQRISHSSRKAHYADRLAGLTYDALALAGEAGELANWHKKYLRGDFNHYPVGEIIDELGDILWYAADLAGSLGYTLSQVAQRNIEKLAERKRTGGR